MATCTITISDDVQEETINLTLEFNPPIEGVNAKLTAAQQVAVKLIEYAKEL